MGLRDTSSVSTQVLLSAPWAIPLPFWGAVVFSTSVKNTTMMACSTFGKQRKGTPTQDGSHVALPGAKRGKRSVRRNRLHDPSGRSLADFHPNRTCRSRHALDRIGDAFFNSKQQSLCTSMSTDNYQNQ